MWVMKLANRLLCRCRAMHYSLITLSIQNRWSCNWTNLLAIRLVNFRAWSNFVDQMYVLFLLKHLMCNSKIIRIIPFNMHVKFAYVRCYLKRYHVLFSLCFVSVNINSLMWFKKSNKNGFIDIWIFLFALHY